MVFLLLTALIRNFYKLSWRGFDEEVRTQSNKPHQGVCLQVHFSTSQMGQTSRQHVLNIYIRNNAYADVFQTLKITAMLKRLKSVSMLLFLMGASTGAAY